MAEISRLPGPVADLWEWQLKGSCREADPTLFFHPEGERGPARRNRDRLCDFFDGRLLVRGDMVDRTGAPLLEGCHVSVGGGVNRCRNRSCHIPDRV